MERSLILGRAEHNKSYFTYRRSAKVASVGYDDIALVLADHDFQYDSVPMAALIGEIR